MRCEVCGADTNVVDTRELNGWTLRRRRQCPRGHRMVTYEVIETVWNTAKHRNRDAVITAEKRALIDTRNRAMLADLDRGMQAKVVALNYGVSESTVSLVKRARDKAQERKRA